MKTDLQLQQDVVEELKFEPSIREEEIGVATKDGVVTLTGFVDTYVERFTAERVAERVGGVKAIADEIKVKLPGTHQRTDTEIAHAAVNALRWDVQVPDDRIKISVDAGWIALDGETDWQYQKRAAEDAVRNLTGVKGVSNLISVKPKKVSTFEVGQKIKDSLRRHAERDANKVTIEAKDGRVTLRGVVSSFTERKDAEHAAWQAQGVTSVDDQIAVVY
jgi:osmotically-inducible protein OsmY